MQISRKNICFMGTVFGRFTVVSVARISGRWKCDCYCECGALKSVRLESLINGSIKSCGCYGRDVAHMSHNRKHGQSHTSTYRVWKKMRSRCHDPSDKGFVRYGGRGIVVCERWERFEHFYQDMGDKPVGRSLERKNNNLGYSPDNCCWATPKEQANNRRSNLVFTIDNHSKTLMQWTESLGLEYKKTLKRIRRGWSIDRALEL